MLLAPLALPGRRAPQGHGETEHRRVVRKPFYLGQTEVTHGQLRRFAGATGYRTDAERGTPLGGHGVGVVRPPARQRAGRWST